MDTGSSAKKRTQQLISPHVISHGVESRLTTTSQKRAWLLRPTQKGSARIRLTSDVSSLSHNVRIHRTGAACRDRSGGMKSWASWRDRLAYACPLNMRSKNCFFCGSYFRLKKQGPPSNTKTNCSRAYGGGVMQKALTKITFLSPSDRP